MLLTTSQARPDCLSACADLLFRQLRLCMQPGLPRSCRHSRRGLLPAVPAACRPGACRLQTGASPAVYWPCCQHAPKLPAQQLITRREHAAALLTLATDGSPITDCGVCSWATWLRPCSLRQHSRRSNRCLCQRRRRRQQALQRSRQTHMQLSHYLKARLQWTASLSESWLCTGALCMQQV